MAALVRQGYRIIVDTAIEDAIFAETPDGKRRLKFEPSKNGLYFHDTENRQNVFLNSQYENSKFYTKRQIAQAKEARNAYQMAGYPSVEDFKNAVRYHMIDDCPVTVKDIEVAEDVFGKSIHALKDKMTRKTPH